VIKGGTFTTAGAYSLNNQAGSSMTIDNATVKGGIYNEATSLIINSGNIQTTREGYTHAIYHNGGELVVNGGTFMGNGNEVINANDKVGLIELLTPYKVYDFEFKRLEECEVGDVPYWVNEIIDTHASTEDMYYRKVNFLYAFFADKLDNEECLVTRHDCELIIKYGEVILENKDVDLAKKLLPTQSGFFFGSTDYNDYYFMDVKDVVEQFKEYLENWTDDTMGWVYFSW
jgi:hypothetical protein